MRTCTDRTVHLAAWLWLALWPALTATPAQARMRLSLEECIQTALQHNKGLAVAGEKVDEVETGVAESRGRFYPQVSTRATYTRLDETPYIPLHQLPLPGAGGGTPARIPVGDDDNYALILSAQQTLYSGGKLHNGYRAAQAAARAQSCRFRQDRADLILEVQKGYYGLLEARRIRTAAAQAVAQMTAHVEDVEHLYQAGMAAQNEVLKARVQLSHVRVVDVQAANRVRLAAVALCNVLGVPLDSALVPTTGLQEEIPDPAPSCAQAVALGLRQRPELAALEGAVEAARRGLAVARGQFRPDLSLMGNYKLKRPDRENDPDFYSSWDLTLGLQWQAFDGGIRAAQVARLRAQLAQARKRADQMRDQITLQITRACLNLGEARERIRASARNVAQAEENFRVTRERFEQGVVTSTEVLDAQTLLLQARVDHATALADYQMDRAELNRATGTEWNGSGLSGRAGGESSGARPAGP